LLADPAMTTLSIGFGHAQDVDTGTAVLLFPPNRQHRGNSDAAH